MVTDDHSFIRKPFFLSTVIDNMLISICQRFGRADDITRITLTIDDSVSNELEKEVQYRNFKIKIDILEIKYINGNRFSIVPIMIIPNEKVTHNF